MRPTFLLSKGERRRAEDGIVDTIDLLIHYADKYATRGVWDGTPRDMPRGFIEKALFWTGCVGPCEAFGEEQISAGSPILKGMYGEAVTWMPVAPEGTVLPPEVMREHDGREDPLLQIPIPMAWRIEPLCALMAQAYKCLASSINGMKQPFLTTVFTASSHHPYTVPEQYRDSLKNEGGQPIHKCVRYTDLALRRFFERASKEPWYQNTIFVLVADHTNQASHDVYKTDLGLYSIPIIFFAPDGSITPAMRDDVIVQQTDITPTLLHLLGYSKPYLAFGDDLLSADSSQTWAFNYNAGVYQFVKGDLLLQFDGTKATALYRFKTDRLLKQNLVGSLPEQQLMETQLKAIIQQYMSRMNENRLLPDR